MRTRSLRRASVSAEVSTWMMIRKQKWKQTDDTNDQAGAGDEDEDEREGEGEPRTRWSFRRQWLQIYPW